MAENIDTYTTIESIGQAIYKEKGSKFLSFAIPIASEEEADTIRKQYKKKYYDATHVVYAFRIGATGQIFRAADDGEPSGSSGLPVLNTIRSKNITNIIVLVVRYFGGTKLGIPGLISAYSKATELALDATKTIEKSITNQVAVQIPYSLVNFVMRIVKENNLQILSMDGQTQCNIIIAVPHNQTNKIVNQLNSNGVITI